MSSSNVQLLHPKANFVSHGCSLKVSTYWYLQRGSRCQIWFAIWQPFPITVKNLPILQKKICAKCVKFMHIHARFGAKELCNKNDLTNMHTIWPSTYLCMWIVDYYKFINLEKLCKETVCAHMQHYQWCQLKQLPVISTQNRVHLFVCSEGAGLRRNAM